MVNVEREIKNQFVHYDLETEEIVDLPRLEEWECNLCMEKLKCLEVRVFTKVIILVWKERI